MALAVFLAVTAGAGLRSARAGDTDDPAREGAPVRRVSWSGNRSTRDFVIAREVRTCTGCPFSNEVLGRDRLRLENLGIFASVEATAAVAADSVDVEFLLVEMPSYVPYVVFAYTEENGVSLGPALGALNLFGRDIAGSVQFAFGGTTTFGVDLVHPWVAGDHVSVSFTSARLERDDPVRGFEERSLEISPWVGTHAGERGRLEAGFSYLRMESATGGITLDADGEDNLYSAGVRAGYDTRDSWLWPHRGWRGRLEIVRTGGLFGGDGDFWTGSIDATRFQPMGRHTLALGLLTSLQSGSIGRDIPVYLDYRMGGANTIRGHDVEELGRTVFGKNQALGTIEYQYELRPMRALRLARWPVRIGVQLAAFADAGTAWSNPDDLVEERLHAGYGAGLRLIVPGVEMLRFDVAFSPEGTFFHFATGSKFTAQRMRLR